MEVDVFKSSTGGILRSVFDLAPFDEDFRPVVCRSIPDSRAAVPLLGAVVVAQTFPLLVFELLLCEELEEAAVAVDASCVEDADDKTLCLSGPLLLEAVFASVLSECTAVTVFEVLLPSVGLLYERSPGNESSSSAKSSSECMGGSLSPSESRLGPNSSYTLSFERYGSGPGELLTKNGGDLVMGYPLG